MAYLHQLSVDFPETGLNVTVANGAAIDLSGVTDKGFDFLRDGAAGFTAVLEGSVAGMNWTTIDGLAATAQGAIPAQYNYVRIRGTVQGAKGATTALKVAGKEV
jgi:hypothetical protein